MRSKALLLIFLLSVLLGRPPTLAAVVTYDDPGAFLSAAGATVLQDFEEVALFGGPDSGGTVTLVLERIRIDSDPSSLKVLDFEDAGNHNTTPGGSRYLAADTDSVTLSARLTLTFDRTVNRFGLFVIDLDTFDMGVTVNGTTHLIPAAGNGVGSYFGIISDTPFSQVVFDSLGSEAHFSLDDISMPPPSTALGASFVPDGTPFRPGAPLSVAVEPGGDLWLSWGVPCSTTDVDYVV